MPAQPDDRWMPARLALVRTHTRLWDQAELQMRRDHGLTTGRYDVPAHLDMAGGRLGLSELASAILLSPSGLSRRSTGWNCPGLSAGTPIRGTPARHSQ